MSPDAAEIVAEERASIAQFVADQLRRGTVANISVSELVRRIRDGDYPKMRLGPLVVHVARTMYLQPLVFVDGRKYDPILTDVRDGRAVFGRGFVLAFGGLLLWATVDLYRAEIVLED